jgi:DNA-binding XRE family transcriptional regulator
MRPPSITLNGTAYIILELAEYERLTTLAKAADLPPLPEPDKDGNVPAVPFARAVIARNLIRDRTAAGLTQRQLAKLAGVPVETLCRIETGQRTPSVPTIDKIDRALRKALDKLKARAPK